MLRLPKPHLKLPIRRTGAHERDEQEFSRGQIIVLFALSLIVLVGIMGLAIDVTFAWVNELRIQKAADAGALAGAVYLPDDPGTGQTASLAETVQNGYTNQTGGVVVDAHQDATNKEQMDVTITAPIPTFFMRIFGITSLSSSRTAHAQFHLPVPMGSPLNVFGFPTQKDLQGNPLNYWAAIQGPCTLKANGDPYATKDTTSVDSNCSTATVDNTEYKVPTTGDPGAYNYAIKVPVAGNLVVQLYDPEFCARASQNSDTGDIAFTSANFNTVFTLYNPSDTPYDLTDDTAIVSTSYPGNGTTGNATDTADSCSSYYVTKPSDYKGKWITFTTFAAAPGTYRLNVGTTTQGTKAADGTNEFGLQATLNGGAGLQPQVYAGLAGTDSAMSIYNNLSNGTSYIYLAQINATMQGKTMEVDLFDPGDITKPGTGVMYFEQPVGSGYTDIAFKWRNSGTTLGPSGSTTSVPAGGGVQTAYSDGTHPFNGDWLVVTIQIPQNYAADLNGWWKIKYVIGGAGAPTDRTTWRVEIKDAPVHLVP